VKENATWVCVCRYGTYKDPSDKHCIEVKQQKSGMNTGILIGIIAGSIAFIAIVTILVIFIHYIPKL